MSFYRSLVYATAISILAGDIFATPVLPRGNVAPIVDLGYAQYEGTTLNSGVNQYLGMRFAAAPLGELRFRAPADPVVVSGVQEAKAVTVSFFIPRFVLMRF
jgi:hypothetical protein